MAAGGLWLAEPCPIAADATFVIVNLDDPNEGLNDPTLFTPVGGNPATTLGEARLRALEAAAAVWGEILASGVPIEVAARFEPLGGDETGAVLAQAGPEVVGRDFDGAPIPFTWYPIALANRIGGVDLAPADADVGVEFNADVDGDLVLGSTHFYYGLDANPPEGDLDFVTVAMHEVAHGLGFLALFDVQTGEKLLGLDDVFLRFLVRTGAVPSELRSMSDTERAAAVIAAPDLRWVGPSVVARAGADVEMYAPNPVEPGSSVSHFATSLTPDELMEPFDTGPKVEVGLADELLRDVGWGDPNDLDLDGKPDTIDECTVYDAAAQRPEKPRAVIARIDRGPGEERLTLRGFFVPGNPTATIAPHEAGVHVRLADGEGVILDVSLPGGLVGASPSTPCSPRDGWKERGALQGPVYVYKNVSGFLDPECTVSAEGIKRVLVKDRRTTKGDILFVVRGVRGTYAPAEVPPSHLEASLALGARTEEGEASAAAQSGACAEVVWSEEVSLEGLALGGFDTPGEAWDLALEGTLAYVADGDAGLRILDVANPAAVVEVGSVETPGFAQDVALQGTLAYVADGASGLRIVDVSSPAAPVEVGFAETPGFAEAVAVSGSLAYVADGSGGLRILDVSNPASPVQRGAVDPVGSVRDVAALASSALVVDTAGGLRSIDVSDPNNPVEVAALPPFYEARALAVSGTLAYLADAAGVLAVVDVSDPAHPFQVGLGSAAGTAWDVAADGDRVYVSFGTSGVRVLDVSDPSLPIRLGRVPTEMARGLQAAGGLLYVGDGDTQGLRILEVNEVAKPPEACRRFPRSGTPRRLRCRE